MKPPTVRYGDSGSVDEAVKLKIERAIEVLVPAERISRPPVLNSRLVRPEALIDITEIDGQRTIVYRSDVLEAGEGPRQYDFDRHLLVSEPVSLSPEAVAFIENRHEGTVGGSIPSQPVPASVREREDSSAGTPTPRTNRPTPTGGSPAARGSRAPGGAPPR
ncbi:hypothetical protein [Streptomyces sp. NPDC096311]|uniref:hypothetical protein n=1 Tax=Streptomyces sp. NPDC096311 TaxID=3366083 RepID=UPI0038031363